MNDTFYSPVLNTPNEGLYGYLSDEGSHLPTFITLITILDDNYGIVRHIEDSPRCFCADFFKARLDDIKLLRPQIGYQHRDIACVYVDPNYRCCLVERYTVGRITSEIAFEHDLDHRQEVRSSRLYYFPLVNKVL